MKIVDDGSSVDNKPVVPEQKNAVSASLNETLFARSESLKGNKGDRIPINFASRRLYDIWQA